jgi:hypothetical protein
MAKPWFRIRSPERGGSFDVTSWEGAAILAAYALLDVTGILSIILSGASLAGIGAAILCCVGGTYGLMRTVRAHSKPEA